MEGTIISITISGVISILSIIMAILTFAGNKKKDAVKHSRETQKTQTDNEIRLVSIDKDVQYIRTAIDGVNEKLELHEQKINMLEKQIIKMTSKKGGCK